MRLLLDTHAFLWWVINDGRLSQAARRAIADDDNNDVLISAASAWEITTKHRLGKLPGADLMAADVAGAIANQGFGALAITVDDAARAGALPGTHRDPFDRMLIAQALTHNLVFVSNESRFDWYGVRRLW
jgi:PIN domain nuclease of toxin-antitoxin system